MRFERCQHRGSIARIDYQSMGAVMNKPDIVIGKGRDWRHTQLMI